MLMEWNIELGLNIFKLFTTKRDKESTYCDWRGRMFKSLNNSRQDSPLLAFIMVLTTLFCILKREVLQPVLPQKIMPYDMIRVKTREIDQAQGF